MLSQVFITCALIMQLKNCVGFIVNISLKTAQRAITFKAMQFWHNYVINDNVFVSVLLKSVS